jgi:hypothetical protein
MRSCKLAGFPLALIFSAVLRVAAQDTTALTGILEEDRPNTHNMIIVGSEAVFLSHLPMFQDLNERRTDYTSPHRYQVILEVNFTANGKDATDIYLKDRQNNLETKMYTLKPEQLVLAHLFTPDVPRPALASFKATVINGHLERDPHHVIAGLEDVIVTVKKIVHAQKFDPAAVRPERLSYLLFGKGSELFLAHLITKPPDFDQIVMVKVADHSVTEQELNRGIIVVFPGRDNTAAQRIKEKEQALGQFQVAGIPQSLQSAVQAGTEFYFEEGELAMPPTFKQTPEEAKAGF